MALLLSNFGSSSLSAPTADQDTNKIAEAFARIGRFIDWIKRTFGNFFKSIKNKLTNQISDQPPGERTHHNSWIWNKGFYPLVTSIYHFSISQPKPNQLSHSHSLSKKYWVVYTFLYCCWCCFCFKLKQSHSAQYL